jgi:hypothetical protein
VIGAGHHETALHWAASNDDVELIDALGMMPELAELVAAGPPPDDLNGALWQACANGQFDTVRYLVEHGADVNWGAPWSGESRLDVLRCATVNGAELMSGTLVKDELPAT